MRYLIIIFFIFTASLAFSQEQKVNEKRIGLVLSGGGAKGLAHIGALKVIDSLGVEIDYVAGTSMGAIVGSLYASGYSGKQLDSIFRTVDFDILINDNLPRKSKSFYERGNSEKYIFNLPFDNFKVQLPSALSRGQNTYSLLSRLFLEAGAAQDFNKLPIPFFCIATDVETGKQVLIDNGNLTQSVLASGALPSLFQPVTIGDSVLIDGGVVNNYPIYELREKGADIIIGVDVQDSLVTRTELKSAPDILLQINNYRTINDMKNKSKETDIYIKPNIKNYSVVSFSQAEDIVMSGEVATRQKLEELSLLKKKKKEVIQRPVIKSIDSIYIDLIDVTGNSNYSRAYILGKLKLKGKEKISYERFNDGVNNLVATENFQSFYYYLLPSTKGYGYNLFAEVNEVENTSFIKLGLHYDDLYKSAALINFTKKRFLTKNDVMLLDFIVGDNIRYNFEYFVDNGFYLSVGINSRFNHFKKNVDATTVLTEDQIEANNLNKIEANLYDFTNQIYLQTLFRKDFSLGVGFEHKHLKIDTETLSGTNAADDFTFENSHYLSLFGRLRLDTYSDKYFSKSGIYFDGDFHLYIYSSDFNNTFSEFSIAKAKLGFAQSLSSKLSFNLETEGGFKIGEDETPYLDFALGGYGNDFINNIIPFYGYDFISLTGDSFVKAKLNLDFELFKKHHLLGLFNMANVADDIFEDGEWITSPDFIGYGLGYSIESFLGPIELKYTYSPETKRDIWFFNLGFWF